MERNKIDYKKSLLLGFGFFAVSITWSIYNSYVPIILGKFIKSATIIGFIMTIDNYLAIFIQPMVGNWSDRLNTRFGKRMPFILLGMPIAGFFLFIIPNYWNLASFVIFICVMNLAMSIFRSPVISLMPDITHKENRSKVNSLINLMGGIGSIMAYFVGAKLWDINESFPFYMAGGFVFVSLIVLYTFIKEKRDVIEYEASNDDNEKVNLVKSVKNAENPRNIIFLLLAICFWFIAYQGIEAHFSNYGINFLGLKASQATMSFFFISISFLIFAVPAGIVGTKLGKKKTITIGISGLVISFIVLGFLRNINAIRGVFLIVGFFWSMININSYPFVTDMAPKGQTGSFTGLYYFASSVAAIVSPPLLGFIIDAFGYKYSFFYGALFFLLAFVCINQLKVQSND